MRESPRDHSTSESEWMVAWMGMDRKVEGKEEDLVHPTVAHLHSSTPPPLFPPLERGGAGERGGRVEEG